MERWQGWPTTEDVSSYSTEVAERLRRAQIAFGTAISTVPGVIAQAHRTLERHAPSLHQSVVLAAGYEDAFFKPQALESLRYWVLECNVDVSKMDRSGYTPLSAVANEPPHSPEQKERIQFLLQFRVNVNSPSGLLYNRTALHLLIGNNNTEVALFLIDHTRNSGHFLDFKRQDVYGNTPLILAIKKEQVEVADAILNEMEKFRSDIGLNLCDVNGQSALEHAFTLKVEKIIVKLLGLSAKHFSKKHANQTRLCQQEEILNHHDFNYLRFLVSSYEIDVHHDRLGYNALSCVASDPLHARDQKECIKFLLQLSVNVNSVAHMYHNRTPLHLLIAYKNEEVALFLIEYAREKEHFIVFERQDVYGNTPLILAIKTMQLSIVLAILNEMEKFKANIGLNLLDVDGRTALDCAVILGEIHIIPQLIALGARTCTVSNYFLNIAKLNEQVIRSILESVDVNPDQVCEDKKGNRVLLYEKCLQNKSNVPVIFWPRLHEGLSILPPWRFYTDLPPLHPQVDLPLSAHKKHKPKF